MTHHLNLESGVSATSVKDLALNLPRNILKQVKIVPDVEVEWYYEMVDTGNFMAVQLILNVEVQGNTGVIRDKCGSPPMKTNK